MNKTKLIIVSLLILTGINLSGQTNNISFFKQNGSINYSEELSNDLGYTLIHLDNRADDVLWAHVVYSIVDLRDNMNSQLAFPVGHDVNYKNLFKLISDAIASKATVYYPNDVAVTPNFETNNIVPIQKLSDVFSIETNVAGAQYIDPLFQFDSISNNLSVNNRIYDRFSKQINKFLIQQVFYFDTHLSQMSSKIIGIAPMMTMEDAAASLFPDFGDENNNNGGKAGTTEIKNALRESILCWLLYDDLKPFFSTQLVLPENNIAQRVSYHEYFSKKMFSSYLVGDNNLLKKLYSSNVNVDANEIKKEISEIQRKLVKIESEIWFR
ncbi:MAG: hypothetical protein BGO29_09205 [Bacteroidales bacterium 36-12]|nr:MAG: hypothetical protein BGO29_09205 [Bacteroidales bacterium 36-12]